MPFPKIPGLAVFGVGRTPRADDFVPAPPSFETQPPAVPQNEGDNFCPSTGSEKSATFRFDRGGWRGFDAAKVARLHAMYYDPAFSVAQVAREFGVATSTLLRWIAELEWPSRRQMRRQSMAVLRETGANFSVHRPDPENGSENAAIFPADDKYPRDDAGDLLQSIEQQVRREIALMQSRMCDTSVGAGERNARTLASLVRTLRALHGLRDGEASRAADAGQVGADDAPPRSLEQLRDDLAARLAKLRAESGQA